MTGDYPEGPLPGLGRALSHRETDNLDKYLNLLSKWQRTHRLVGSTRRDWVIENIVVDSLMFLELVPAEATRLVDVGSGAGIPGVPIAIVRPDLELVLVEPMRRRASFLSTVIRELSLSNASVAEFRIENFAPVHRAEFDVVLMRCAGPVHALAQHAAQMLKSRGRVVASAPPDASEEHAAGGEIVTISRGHTGRRFLLWRSAEG